MRTIRLPALALAALLASAAARPDAPATAPPRIVIVGDSTASVYGPERAPRTGWGQVLDRFVDPRVAVLNRAQSGRSSRSFVAEGWFDKVAAELRPGDLFLIQFGHNDEKRDAPERYTEPEREFPGWLTRYLDAAQAHGARAVLLTPTARRQFESGEPVDTHGAYAEAIRRLAEARGVPLLDITARSRDVLKALGEESSKAVYLHDPRAAPPTTRTSTSAARC
jgi:lysophospholipase L1-like esterase